MLTVGDTGNKCQNWTLAYNKLYATGAGQIFAIGAATADLGGGICDYNKYSPKGAALFGAVRADSSVLDLTELRAAWSGYGDGSNDSHSKLIRSRRDQSFLLAR